MLIFRASRGIPRVINTICDMALMYGFADQKSVLDSKLIINVLEDKATVRRSHDQGGVTPSPAGKAVTLANFQGGDDWTKPGSNVEQSNRRVTEFNRDAAKFLFNKYYRDK